MKPVFIGGNARSGAPLLGAMLGAHKVCPTTPDSQFEIGALRSQGKHQNAADVQAALRRLVEHRSFREWGVVLNPAVNYLKQSLRELSHGRLWLLQLRGQA